MNDQITVTDWIAYIAKMVAFIVFLPVIVPSAIIAMLASGGNYMDIGGGMAAAVVFGMSAVGFTALYIGLAVGYLL